MKNVNRMLILAERRFRSWKKMTYPSFVLRHRWKRQDRSQRNE
uniref:Uncharacterized protein n=1 Tax=Brassica oleracea TaxID=3712 RepID=A0A3P6CVQ6_BRAOL|nr:unnamed protein product [Brassica oleracea]